MSETTKKLMKLVKKLDLLQEEIEIELGNLPNIGGECHCKHGEYEHETYIQFHRGNLFNEYFIYCLLCGGLRE